MGINWGDIGSSITNFGGKVGETLISPSPLAKLVTNPKKAIEDPKTLLPDTIQALGNGGPVRTVAEQWQEVGEDAKNFLLSPNPIIQVATGNAGDIFSGKSYQEQWGNVTSSVDEKVVQPVNETVVQPVIKETEKIKETVKETVTNVTKGVSEALPIIAIGGAAVLAVSLLLGRR